MKKSALRKSVLGIFLVLVASGYAFSEDGEIKLNSNDGSTKLIVQDKDAATVFSVDSDGNTVISGTAAIAGSGFSVGSSTLVVKAGNVGIGTTGPGTSNASGTMVQVDGTGTGYNDDGQWNIGGNAYTNYGDLGWRAGQVPAVLRGGAWGDGAYAGVFVFNADYGPSLWDSSFGFRCGRRR
ncbi:MAG: hypothetical protein HY796_02075 [Elusimicrobia bacterium]|nr:hypothetical protein [Elusimicrobiota bacterium]